MSETVTTEFETLPEVDNQETAPAEEVISPAEFKRRYAQAMKEKKEAEKSNAVLLKQMEAEDKYWELQANIPRHRYNKMYYTIESLKLEDAYKAAVAKIQEQSETPTV